MCSLDNVLYKKMCCLQCHLFHIESIQRSCVIQSTAHLSRYLGQLGREGENSSLANSCPQTANCQSVSCLRAWQQISKSVVSHLETKGFSRLWHCACVIPMTHTAVKQMCDTKQGMTAYVVNALFSLSTRKGLHCLNTTKYNPFVTWAPLFAKVAHCITNWRWACSEWICI